MGTYARWLSGIKGTNEDTHVNPVIPHVSLGIKYGYTWILLVCLDDWVLELKFRVTPTQHPDLTEFHVEP